MSADMALEPAVRGSSDERLFFDLRSEAPSAAWRDVLLRVGGTGRDQSKRHVHGGIVATKTAVGCSVLDIQRSPCASVEELNRDIEPERLDGPT